MAERTESFPEKLVPKKTRTESPLVFALTPDPQSVSLFVETVNALNQDLGVKQVALPKVEAFFQGPPLKTFTFEYASIDESQQKSFEFLLTSIYQSSETEREGHFEIPLNRKAKLTRLAHRALSPQASFTISFTNDRREGLHFTGHVKKPLIGIPSTRRAIRNKQAPSQGSLKIRETNSMSEAELGYLLVMAGLILEGKINMSTQQEQEETKDARKQVFLSLYRKMLSQQIPVVERDDIYGLDEQIENLNRNVFRPLISGNGTPMNTVIIGPNGVGKSLLVNYFASQSDCLVVPVRATTLLDENNFNINYLTHLQRVRVNLDLPVILAVDDMEPLFHAGKVISSQGIAQNVDADRKTASLRILDRLANPHRLFVFGTTNETSIDPGFIRRLHIIRCPLPSDDQRRHMLEAIIPANTIPEDQRDAVLTALVDNSKGFNYGGLALIPEYFKNLHPEESYTNGSSPMDLFLEALEEAQVQTPLEELRVLDRAAQRLARQEDTNFLAAKIPKKS